MCDHDPQDVLTLGIGLWAFAMLAVCIAGLQLREAWALNRATRAEADAVVRAIDLVAAGNPDAAAAVLCEIHAVGH